MQYALVYSILIKMSVDIQQFNFMAHDLKSTAADSGPVVQDGLRQHWRVFPFWIFFSRFHSDHISPAACLLLTKGYNAID